MPIRDADNKLIRWIGTNTDIDDQKKATQALAASDARLRLAIKAGQLAVWEIDGVPRQIRASAALNRLYGFPADDRPTLDDYLARYAPGELERVTKLAEEAAARGEIDFEAEVRHLWPDGTEKWLLVRAQSKEPDRGFAGHSIGVVIDIMRRLPRKR